MSERVRVEVADHVAEVVLTRPDKHNALDLAMIKGIVGAAEEVAATPGVRAVVLRGEGPSFCAGIDLHSLGGGLAPEDEILQRAPGHRSNLAQRSVTDWIDLPVPVIAALHGNALGGGFQIALGPDIRIAAPGTKLCVMEAKWGLVPDMAITSTLSRLVRSDVAKELTCTARVFDAGEALELGIVTRVEEDPVAAARALAREIAGRSPDAVRAAKRLLDSTWKTSVEEGLLLETQLQHELIAGANHREAVRAGIAREEPRFEDPEPAALPADSDVLAGLRSA